MCVTGNVKALDLVPNSATKKGARIPRPTYRFSFDQEKIGDSNSLLSNGVVEIALLDVLRNC